MQILYSLLLLVLIYLLLIGIAFLILFIFCALKLNSEFSRIEEKNRSSQ